HLRPGTVVVIRDEQTVQVGLAPDRAVMVTAPPSCGTEGLAALLTELKGGATLETAASRPGADADAVPAVARGLVRRAGLGPVRLHGVGPHGGMTGSPGASRPASAGGVSRGDAPRPAPVRRVHVQGSGQISEALRGPLSVNGGRVTT